MFILAAAIAAALNLTYSPDSTKVAYTSGGDLYCMTLPDSTEMRLTFDGSDVILNGRASWVYYEEIFGRQSAYRAFWWSPDSRKIAYYRFDESRVGTFPIFSAEGQYGTLGETRYPKAGTPNPSVSVRIADVSTAGRKFPGKAGKSGGRHRDTASADLEIMATDSTWEYLGTPFWSDDSRMLFLQRMPRRQNKVELLRINASDGHCETVYSEQYDTWIDWIEGMLFGKDGLYMARSFETGWEQIYYLSYDGRTLRRLTDGPNDMIQLLDVDESAGTLRFVAKRGSRIHPAVYKLSFDGTIEPLTDENLYAARVSVEPDGQLSCRLSNARIDPEGQEHPDQPRPEIVTIENDGYTLYGLKCLPKDFDPSRQYPVVMEVYGGPGTAYVRDYWQSRDASNKWCWENGIIWMLVDPRSAGENGRKGKDEAFGRMTVIELEDYIAWAEYARSLPYVKPEKIGVEGFSFGGTTTAMLVLRYPEYFCCGIAGGGVYDWALYDSHYTERYMDTPQANPEGYREASVLHYVREGLVSKDYKPYSLKLTHGTGDDNVHFQNTLQLVDALEEAGIQFDLMIYPDGMHGYRGAQHEHDLRDAASFWAEHLLEGLPCLH